MVAFTSVWRCELFFIFTKFYLIFIRMVKEVCLVDCLGGPDWLVYSANFARRLIASA